MIKVLVNRRGEGRDGDEFLLTPEFTSMMGLKKGLKYDVEISAEPFEGAFKFHWKSDDSEICELKADGRPEAMYLCGVQIEVAIADLNRTPFVQGYMTDEMKNSSGTVYMGVRQ